jgi:nucleoside-diphosphate-sugar epimerase
MSLKHVFVAGASGAIGSRLCRLLVEDGYTVFGTTRNPQNIAALQSLGVVPLVVDVFDAGALCVRLLESRARYVVHQLTDLPKGLDPARMPEARVRNARIREIGTQNLITAAKAAKVERLVAQSISFAYAPGPMPYDESAPLNVDATDAAAAMTARAVASLESQVLAGPFAGIVLRYGKLYGPGTGFDNPPPGGPVHVDAAADAARRALTTGEPGIYNIAEQDGAVDSTKARTLLHWHSGFRIGEGSR